MGSEKIVLSESTEFDLRGIRIIVYPCSAEKIFEMSGLLEELGKLEASKDLKNTVNKFIDVIFDLVSEDNKELTKDILRKYLTIPAGIKIIQTALGGAMFIKTDEQK